MSVWAAKRFWQQARIEPAGQGWRVVLDDRPVMTPGKQPLILPTKAFADAVAQEWQDQVDLIRPDTMPLTRAANSAIEKVAPQRHAVAMMLADYGGTDLLCYRAEQPEALVALQSGGWDPLIDWAATELQAPLRITHGVIPIEQPAQSLANLKQAVAVLDLFALTALHDLVTLPGSLIIGLAVLRGRITAQDAFDLSRIDEEYQADIWGRDKEADEVAERRRVAIASAEQVFVLSRSMG